MGVLDKIKNALFEVEYVEVEEPDLNDRKAKLKEKYKDRLKTEKPIAKKIVLPEKAEGRVEEIHEEDLKDDNFEARPKDEIIKPSSISRENFKLMDDKDFEVEENHYTPDAGILRADREKTERRETRLESMRQREDKSRAYQNNDLQEENSSYSSKSTHQEFRNRLNNESKGWKNSENHPDNYYSSKTSEGSNSISHDSKPYGMDTSYEVPMHEYGTYERKEERAFFKPSPIISPIYGVLDKNYKKEDVVQKKEIRLTTSYSRNSASVDDIRNKAYAPKQSKELPVEEETKFEVEEDEDEDLLVDLSDNKGKPEVKELTMGDALEYFQDLGLEYNVDYVDASKDRTTPRRARANYDDVEVQEEATEQIIEELNEDSGIKNVKEKNTTKVVEIKKESDKVDTEGLDEDDDNLFDLIDSMYQES